MNVCHGRNVNLEMRKKLKHIRNSFREKNQVIFWDVFNNDYFKTHLNVVNGAHYKIN